MGANGLTMWPCQAMAHYRKALQGEDVLSSGLVLPQIGHPPPGEEADKMTVSLLDSSAKACLVCGKQGLESQHYTHSGRDSIVG